MLFLIPEKLLLLLEPFRSFIQDYDTYIRTSAKFLFVRDKATSRQGNIPIYATLVNSSPHEWTFADTYLLKTI